MELQTTFVPKREFNEVKDSGVREDFDTGSKRDTRVGKGRFDLLPPHIMCVILGLGRSFPHAIERLAKHFENGAVKYGDRNWEKGQNLSRYLDSAARHINKYMIGLDDEDHLIACAWNLACLLETRERIIIGQFDSDLGTKLTDLPEMITQDLFMVESHDKPNAILSSILMSMDPALTASERYCNLVTALVSVMVLCEKEYAADKSITEKQ